MPQFQITFKSWLNNMESEIYFFSSKIDTIGKKTFVRKNIICITRLFLSQYSHLNLIFKCPVQAFFNTSYYNHIPFGSPCNRKMQIFFRMFCNRSVRIQTMDIEKGETIAEIIISVKYTKKRTMKSKTSKEMQLP